MHPHGTSSQQIKHRMAGALALAVWFLLSLFPSVVSAQANVPSRVLVLYWYGKDFPSNVSFEKGLQKAFQTAPSGSIEYYPEYLESNRFPGEDQSKLLRDYLRQKYSDRGIDVVVALAQPSLDFLFKYRNDLFPNAPIVFHTFNPPDMSNRQAGPGLTGVVVDSVFRNTLAAALKLHPKTKQVLVIAGTSEDDKSIELQVKREINEFETSHLIKYLTNLPLGELIDEVTTAPQDSIIFYVRYSRDEPGKTLDPFDALSLIAQSAKVPVYSLGALVGRGSVGGYSVDLEACGARAGEMALKLAGGARVQDVPIVAVPTVPVFDSRQLTRWGISESQLPPGSIVQFKEQTFWQRYRWRITGVIGLVVLQTLLIAGLLVERSRRRRTGFSLAESEERYRDVVETQTELICRFLPDTTLTFVNDAYCRYFQKSRNQLIGTKFIQLVSASAREDLLQQFGSLIETPCTQTHEHEVIRPDGSRGWHQWSNHAITNGGGRVVELQGIGRDITVRKVAEEELRVSEERFAKAFNANPQPMTLTTLDEGRFIDANDSFVSTLGYSRDEVLGHTATELNIWETPEVREDLVKRLKEHGGVRYMETKFRTKGGAFRVFLSSAELIEIAGEKCILVASSDITDRKQLEEALQRSEREFSTLVENSPDVISRLDRDLRYTYVSPTLERIAGVGTHEFVGKTPREVAIPGYDWSAFESSCGEVFSTGKTVVREFTYRERKYRTRIIPEFSADRSIDSLIAISEDVTERLRAEQELADLTVRLFTLQDEERRRIARELHDGAAQNMFGITISLANLQQHTSDESETSRIISECQLLAEQSLTELRTLSYLLHPPILDQAGLVLALQWYVEGFAKRSGIYVDLIAIEDIGRLPSEIETALFRIVQESLTNIRRHSGSETASIRLEKKANEVTLEIADRGIGMPKNGFLESSRGIAELGVGIPGMRQRLIQLGGRLRIESTDHGTTIVAVVPASEGANNGKYSAG